MAELKKLNLSRNKREGYYAGFYFEFVNCDSKVMNVKMVKKHCRKIKCFSLKH